MSSRQNCFEFIDIKVDILKNVTFCLEMAKEHLLQDVAYPQVTKSLRSYNKKIKKIKKNFYVFDPVEIYVFDPVEIKVSDPVE